MTVPDGTIDEVLDWVDNDPSRARQALQQERSGQDRSTLTTKLEAIASRKDATVPQQSANETDNDQDQAPGPDYSTDIELTIEDATIQPLIARDPDVEHDEDDDLAYRPENEDNISPIDGAQVEFFQVASSTRAVAIAINSGEVFLFTAQLGVALKHALDKAVAGLNL